MRIYVPYVLAECNRCKRDVIGQLLHGRLPIGYSFSERTITVVGAKGARHSCRSAAVIDAQARGIRVEAKNECQR